MLKILNSDIFSLICLKARQLRTTLFLRKTAMRTPPSLFSRRKQDVLKINGRRGRKLVWRGGGKEDVYIPDASLEKQGKKVDQKEGWERKRGIIFFLGATGKLLDLPPRPPEKVATRREWTHECSGD